MKNEQFNGIVECRIEEIRSVLSKKAEEYASAVDRLHNFKVAARKRNTTPEDALMGMAAKHDVSIDDLVLWAKDCPEKITYGLVNEKIGDMINYLILLEALFVERLG